MAVATAAANDVDAKFGDEVAQRGGHWLRFHRIDRQAVDVERDAGIGNGRDRQRAIFCQETHRLAHMFWPRRAVQPNHIDSQSNECGHHGRNVGAEQHAPTGVERNLRLNGNGTSYLLHGTAYACDSSSHLQDILAGFDQQNIDSPF